MHTDTMKKIYLFAIMLMQSFVLIACQALTLPTTTTATTTATTDRTTEETVSSSMTVIGTTTTGITTTTSTTTATTTTTTLRDDETSDIILDFDLDAFVFEEPDMAIALKSILSDHAVLQQQKPIRIFGSGTPGSIALVKLVKNADQAVSYKNATIIGASGDFVVELPALMASFATYTLIVSDTVNEFRVFDLVIGEVWIVGGQSNMALQVDQMEGGAATMAAADDPMIRIFYQDEGDHNGDYPYEPAADVKNGVWKTGDATANVADCSGIGYIFAKELHRLLQEERLDVPIAVINTAKGGSNIHSWLPREAMMASDPISSYVLAKGWTFTETGYDPTNWENYNRPSALYNQKIAPLFNFQIKGVLWYQGESDAVYDPTIYSLPLLMDTWSLGFNQNDELLPFILVQLHPYDGMDPLAGPSTQNYSYQAFAFHRQAQFDIVRMERYAASTVLVPIYDVSLKWDVALTQFPWKDPIHPTTKIPVGERAGKAAYTQFYWGAVDFLAPMVESFEYDADSITITFAHVARGLKLIKDTQLGITTLEVFLNNGIRQNVTGIILDQNRIRITGIDISQVAYFAYGYLSRNEAANLASSYGTPAIPFKIKLT